MRARRVVGVVMALVVLWAQGGRAGEFNFEVGKRTLDIVQSFLSRTHPFARQLAAAVGSGVVDAGAQNAADTRRFMWPQINSADPLISMLYGGFSDGMFVGYTNKADDTDFGFTFVTNGTSTCTSLSTGLPIAPCREIFNVSSAGEPLAVVANRAYDPRARTWYNASLHHGAIWSDVYTFAASGKLGITFSQQLHDSADQFVGVVGVDYLLSAIDEFLVEAFAPENRIVYIVDKSGFLVAASEAGVSVQTDDDGAPHQVRAAQCSSSEIRDAEARLSKEGFPLGELLVSNDRYVQALEYTDQYFLRWRVVVLLPIAREQDYVGSGSAGFYVLLFLGSGGTLLTLALALWLFRYRDMAIWKLAQVPILALILWSNLMCYTGCFVAIGKNTDGLCQMRLWWVVLSLTLTCAAFLSKVERVYLIDKNTAHMRQQVVLWWEAAARALLVVVLQAVVLGIGALADPFRTSDRLVGADGVGTLRTQCRAQNGWSLITAGSVIGVLLVAGCVLSYFTRHLSERFAEGRSLMLTFYHGAVVVVVMFGVGLGTGVRQESLFTMIGVAMCWFTLVSQSVLFGPRIWHQVTVGDLTPEELHHAVSPKRKQNNNTA